MANTNTRLNRRNFLLAVGAGGAAGAAAVVARVAPQASAPVAAADKRATRGYVATEHVNRYYRTTKV